MLHLILPEALSFVTATLLLIIVRSREIRIIFKRSNQRTGPEQTEVRRGLNRGVLLELLVFVPSSVILALLVMRPILLNVVYFASMPQETFHAVLGVVSYGFPWATFRRAVTRIALKTLTEARDILADNPEAKEIAIIGAGGLDESRESPNVRLERAEKNDND